LYRESPTSIPKTLKMNVMIFGATCSPACAQYVKNENAKQFINIHPEAVTAIIQNHYVDDYLDSFDTEEAALERVSEVITIHDEANFFIRNFISNSKGLLNNLAAERVSESSLLKITEKDQTYPKILGQWWDTEGDCFKYILKFLNMANEFTTKREVLSVIMKIYDPLGLLANHLIEAKLIMQEMWRLGHNWDDKLPIVIINQWNAWVKSMKIVEKINIKRCYSQTNHSITRREIHVFVDASDKAFAAIVYMRTISSNGIEVSPIAAKSRVAPIKPLSIPCLELQGAVLGVRLADTILKELRVHINDTFYWTDSKTVMAWIAAAEPKRYTQFVAARVGEILSKTSAAQWNWVCSKDNPADEATKQSSRQSIWLTGPKFLQDQEIPKLDLESETVEEMQSIYLNAISTTEKIDWEVINVNWCSSWKRLMKALAIGLTYLKRLKSKNKESPKIIDKPILDMAENLLIRKAQWEGFEEEVTALSMKLPISKNSNIKNLCPIIDENNIMRANGRLDKVEILSSDTKYPILLPKSHYITMLIVRFYHEKYQHKKTETVIAAIRQRFWVVDLRAVLKRVSAICQKCKNDKAKPQAPQMAALPLCRTAAYFKPFTHTGVDYFGPLTVTIGRRSEKRWGALFTCLTTRAVHLELANDLSSNTFIMILKNMQHRRGKIAHIYCDNGTNFVGACREMAQIQQRCATEGIYWHFNPPAAPHFGGAWERMVQEVKSLFPLTKDSLPEVALRSLLIEIEFIINNRPLTHIPIEHEDDEPLTPSHFLIGYSGEAAPSLLDIVEAEASRSIWKKSRLAAQNYWLRWVKEYLPQLISRGKWLNKAEPLKIGDIVTFPNEQVSGRWIKGRVVDVDTAKDGQVRAVVMRVGTTMVKRPAAKVAKLDVRNEKEEK